MTRSRDIANLGDGIATADIGDGQVTDAKIAGMSSSKLSGALPAIDGSALTGVSAGKVLQVVHTLKQNTFSGTSNIGSGWDDITDLNATITPSSTSSVIVGIVQMYASPNPSNYTIGSRLKRNIGGGADSFPFLGDTRGSTTRMSGFNNSGAGAAQTLGFVFRDTPSTTSSVVYTIQAASESGSDYVIGGSQLSNSSYMGSVPSTITLMEIDPS